MALRLGRLTVEVEVEVVVAKFEEVTGTGHYRARSRTLTRALSMQARSFARTRAIRAVIWFEIEIARDVTSFVLMKGRGSFWPQALLVLWSVDW